MPYFQLEKGSYERWFKFFLHYTHNLPDLYIVPHLSNETRYFQPHHDSNKLNINVYMFESSRDTDFPPEGLDTLQLRSNK